MAACEPIKPCTMSIPQAFALENCRLYGILDLGYVSPLKSISMASAMLEGGVEILQLRAKGIPKADILSIAIPLAELSRKSGVPFLLNDHPDLVQECGADGAHVGQDDMSVAVARSLAGDGKIIGLSTHSLAQARAAQDQTPDYIGFGPLFATPTKPDYKPIGTADIQAVHEHVTIPVFCIGGIKRENLPAVLQSGAKRVVIVSGILQASDVRDYCRDCLTLFH
jgi:thiamine-phosphate pyrophosphorylase